MSDFTIFIVGIVVTLITGMGVITSQIYLGYKYDLEKKIRRQQKNDILTKPV